MGEYCQLENPCTNKNPCRNGGTCKVTVDKSKAEFECTCPLGKPVLLGEMYDVECNNCNVIDSEICWANCKDPCFLLFEILIGSYCAGKLHIRLIGHI